MLADGSSTKRHEKWASHLMHPLLSARSVPAVQMRVRSRGLHNTAQLARDTTLPGVLRASVQTAVECEPTTSGIESTWARQDRA